MAFTYDGGDWARIQNGQIQLKNADGSWSYAGTPEHAESMSYVQKAADSSEVDKLIAYARAGGTLNAEQQAFLANPLLGMDSFGQGGRWGEINLFDNQFSPQQAGALMQFGVPAQLSDADKAAGSHFNWYESPAQQSARDDDGGLFGGGLGSILALAALAYGGYGLLGGLGEGAALASADAMGGLGSLASQWAALEGTPTLVMGGDLAAGGLGAFASEAGFGGLEAAATGLETGYGINGDLTLEQFLTSPDSVTGLEGFGGSQGIPAMDTLGSTSWLESAANSLKHGDTSWLTSSVSPTQLKSVLSKALGGGSTPAKTAKTAAGATGGAGGINIFNTGGDDSGLADAMKIFSGGRSGMDSMVQAMSQSGKGN